MTIHGDQKEVDEIGKDSPTVRKLNINILLAIAGRNKLQIKACDISR